MAASGLERPIGRCRLGASFALYVVGVCINRIGTVATTNYDLLIEIAAVQEGFEVTYGDDDYKHGKINVLKIHGSRNCWPDIPYIYGMPNVEFKGVRTFMEGPMKWVSQLEAIRIAKSFRWLSPAMSAYVEGKEAYICPNAIRQLQLRFAKKAMAANRLFVIGLMVNENDRHIWGPLAKSQGRLSYVGFEPEDFLDWAQRNGRRRAYVLGRTFSDSLPRIGEEIRRL